MNDPLGDVGSTIEEGDQQAANIQEQKGEIIRFSEEDSSAQDSGSLPLSGSAPIKRPLIPIKEMKSDWIKASYNGVVRRLHSPPRNLEELKVIFCTRYAELQPLLELDQTSMI